MCAQGSSGWGRRSSRREASCRRVSPPPEVSRCLHRCKRVPRNQQPVRRPRRRHHGDIQAVKQPVDGVCTERHPATLGNGGRQRSLAAARAAASPGGGASGCCTAGRSAWLECTLCDRTRGCSVPREAEAAGSGPTREGRSLPCTLQSTPSDQATLAAVPCIDSRDPGARRKLASRSSCNDKRRFQRCGSGNGSGESAEEGPNRQQTSNARAALPCISWRCAQLPHRPQRAATSGFATTKLYAARYALHGSTCINITCASMQQQWQRNTQGQGAHTRNGAQQRLR